MANPETPVYPAAVATDLELPPWTDRYRTTLVAGIDAGDTSIIVADATGLNTPCVITIDNEQILIASRTGNTLTVDERGFGGTAAAAHIAGSLVRGNLVATMINRLAAEIIAVQDTLGKDLENLAPLPSEVFGIEVFTSSGSWVVPAGVTEVEYDVIGGGGGGGGGSGSQRGGGGGGAGEHIHGLAACNPGETATITIGTAGAGGTNAPTSGVNGGTTSVSGAGLSLTALGGVGGQSGSAGGAGGASGGAEPGSAAGNPPSRPTHYGGLEGAGAGGHEATNQASVRGSGPNQRRRSTFSAGSTYSGGHGGGTMFGVPGGAGVSAVAAEGYGTGGSGGSATASSVAGGAGRPGLVILRWRVPA